MSVQVSVKRRAVRGSVVSAAFIGLLFAFAGSVAAHSHDGHLSNASVTPHQAVVGQTVVFAVTYTDETGAGPQAIVVKIDTLARGLTAASGTFKTGVVYRLSTTVAAGCHDVRFAATDSKGHLETLAAGSVCVKAPDPTPTPAPTSGGGDPNGNNGGPVGPVPTATPVDPAPDPVDPTPAPTPAGPKPTQPPAATEEPAPQPTQPPAPTQEPAPDPTQPADPTGDPIVQPTPGPGQTNVPVVPVGPPSSGATGKPGAGSVAGGGAKPALPSAAASSGPDPTGSATPASGGTTARDSKGGAVAAVVTHDEGGSAGNARTIPGRTRLPASEMFYQLAPTISTTTAGVFAWAAFISFGRRRRMDPPAPDEVLAAAAATGLDAAAAPGLDVVDESLLPRWRRPSLQAARRADPLRSVAETPHLTFAAAAARPLDGVVRRLVRYRLVRLLDSPDELRSTEIGILDQGDEVQLLERSGAYWRVLCPDGRQGWVHRMTLAEPETDLPAPTPIRERADWARPQLVVDQPEPPEVDDSGVSLLDAYIRARHNS